MIYSRKYSRNFIPLKQDNTSYNLDFRQASGRGLIEIKEGKGKLTVYAQGLKPFNNYNIEFMCFEKGELKNAKVSTFCVDESGKAEIKKDFNPENVFETGSKIEDFNILAINVSNTNKLVTTLVGYIGNEVKWQDKYIMPKKECSFCYPNQDNSQIPETPEMPEIPQMPESPSNSSSLKEALDEREEGLLQREEGLKQREQGIIYKEQNPDIKRDLNNYQDTLASRQEGLMQKEEGLNQKEEGLIQKETALDAGYFPIEEDLLLRPREQNLIKYEQDLIALEEEFIRREQDILNNIDTQNLSELEKGIIEREKGMLEREQGLLEREKGLLQKELGLFEKEDGMRNRARYPQITDNVYKEDAKDIEYIKSKNMPLTPFKNNYKNVKWVRIAPHELITLGYDTYKYANNPFVYSCYKKYNHLMLGFDNGKYILAVPCRYDNNFNIKSFEKFVPLNENVLPNIKNGEYGYRLLNI